FAERLTAGAEAGWLAEAAWTRRNHHPYRAGIPFTDNTALQQALTDFTEGTGPINRTVTSKAAEPVFVFTGMGPQWWAMAR
ncbi:hypothetical protein ACL02S_24320, partial [Nocardia sp. 004]|uniref:hypothetical protein n=1 Tax=Nocardia sp. 004 TaxID=3385978 RepID=UPI00399F460E